MHIKYHTRFDSLQQLERKEFHVCNYESMPLQCATLEKSSRALVEIFERRRNKEKNNHCTKTGANEKQHYKWQNITISNKIEKLLQFIFDRLYHCH